MRYRNILLVNAENDDAENFALVLGAISHKIKSSVETSALEALKKLQCSALSPDIIFLDHDMRYFDGDTFLTLLRDIKGLKSIPVVLYSRNSTAMLQEVMVKFKGVQFLKKRTDFKKLFKSLQKVIIP